MFGKKKIVDEVNEWDAHMKTLRDELAEIGWNMDKKVEDAYIKAQAVAVYLNGSPDWKKACKDRDLAQQRLHCSIGAYDSKRAEILRYDAVNEYNYEQPWSATIESHERIEKHLAYFLKKR